MTTGRGGWREVLGRWSSPWARDPGGQPSPAQHAATLGERRERLTVQRLELLADESVPGRKHRLDAIAAAVADLELELAGIEDGRGTAGRPVARAGRGPRCCD